MQKTCLQCKKHYEITDEDLKFYEKVSPVFNTKKLLITPPDFCPDCRMQQRLSWRNERHLYKRACDLCGQNMVSTYPANSEYKVYCQKCWFSDKWDPLNFGKDFDFNRSFFEQFDELIKKVSRTGLISISQENSDFCNYVGFAKNSYLCFGSVHIEDCMYGSPYESRDCVDSLLLRESELCYECINSEKLYGSAFCIDCSSSSDLMFCYDCKGCKDCIGCAKLRNKQYYIFNEPHTKEEYERMRERVNASSFKSLNRFKTEFFNWLKTIPHQYSEILNSENSTGDHIVNSKNARNCYDVKKAEDCAFCAQILNAKDSQDVNYCEDFELSYNGIGGYMNNMISFCNTVWDSNNVLYSDFCSNSKNIFGCSGVKRGNYQILNKQYTKEEYEELIPKIIEHMKKTGEWGQFFPIFISPFPYNESVANEFFPLNKEEAISKKYKWRNPDPKNYQPQTFVIPDEIKEVPDSIVDEILACSDCGKNYKILQKELYFYKKMNLPIPHKCPDCRHKDRMNLRNPRKINDRVCDKCKTGIKTTYSPEKPEKVYCEACYLKEVY